MKKSQYREAQRRKGEFLISSQNPVFYGSVANGMFQGSKRDFVLLENDKNLYEPIREDVIEYFKKNKVTWWDGTEPSGHVLSSQIACLNHLYPLRNDKSAVLSLLKSVSDDFEDVLPIQTDVFVPAFIQFESVSDEDHLNEGPPSRGTLCTSIDALIYAIHKDGSKYLILIEWKYSEFYEDEDKSLEGYERFKEKCRGEGRKRRYTQLINDSNQLQSNNHSCFYFEPFYQLMRQTLWAEQMVLHSDRETISASNYLHLHIIPPENKDLLEKQYPCSGENMEKTWRNHLKDQSKYLITSPSNFLSAIDFVKYLELLGYLSVRYWK